MQIKHLRLLKIFLKIIHESTEKCKMTQELNVLKNDQQLLKKYNQTKIKT